MSGNVFIVTAPSGAGKTTLVARLLEQDPGVQLSISYTTRAPRPGEADGQHYHFVDRPEFERMRDRGEFLEWAEVHGNLYGTSRTWIEKQTEAGADVLLEIDWQGARQVRRHLRRAIGIFILPPAFEELERRLRDRGQDDEAVIRRRIEAARDEMKHVGEFDYVIINKDLPEAVDDLWAVVKASRLRLGAQSARHAALFQSLERL